jgi:phosphate transport system substrate-binding protein
MRTSRSLFVLVVVAFVGAGALAACGRGGGGESDASSTGGTTLSVSGSTTVNPVAADAAQVLRKRDGLHITVDDQGGSAGGIAQLGAHEVDIAMSSKPISDDDRKKSPDVDFVSTAIGEDAVGIVVRREVVHGGLRSITKDQLRSLFEGRVKNWSELGGPDLDVFVYDKEPGRGTREVLDKFLYGPGGKAPPPPNNERYAIVGGNEETRTKVKSTPGAVAPLSVAFAKGQKQLAVLAVNGVEPTPQHVKDATYQLSRPLFLVTNGRPRGAAKTFIRFVVSSEGQALVGKNGYLTLKELGRPA